MKFHVAADGPELRRMYALAADLRVPILIHFQEVDHFPNEGTWSTGFAKTFESILKAYPKTTFIGHADAFWANVSADYHNEAAYPSGPIKRGGVTDKWLGDYPNLFGDMSAELRQQRDVARSGVHRRFPEAPSGQAALRQRLQLHRRPRRRGQPDNNPAAPRHGRQVRGARDVDRAEALGVAGRLSEDRVGQRAQAAADSGVARARSEFLVIIMPRVFPVSHWKTEQVDAEKESTENQPSGMDRRQWIASAAALAAGAATAPLLSRRPRLQSSLRHREPATARTIVAPNPATSSKRLRKVRGFTHNGIPAFKGIPYARTAAGSLRFMPPAKPAAWTGVRSCWRWGPPVRQGFMCPRDVVAAGTTTKKPSCSSGTTAGRGKIACASTCGHRGRPTTGDARCWSGFMAADIRPARRTSCACTTAKASPPGRRRGRQLEPSARRPRLPESCRDTARSGRAPPTSACSTSLPRWNGCSDNIGHFGGDPRRFSIFGQSGGGGKVGTLMGMPSAKGLFQRASIQSGSGVRKPAQDRSPAGRDAEGARARRSSIDRLQELPYERIVEAGLSRSES